MVYQKFPNSFGALPDTTLSADYTPGDGVIHVSTLPAGVATAGPNFQVKIGPELFLITDLGTTPFLDWVVTAPVEGTTDGIHLAGTAVYLELTSAAMESLRAPDFITATDQTMNGYPNSEPISAVSIGEFSDVDTTSTPPTDGQVLTWVDADSEWKPADSGGGVDDDSGLIEKALVTAKGDLIVATASAVPDNVPVGTDGDVLTADSGATAGVSWQTPAPPVTALADDTDVNLTSPQDGDLLQYNAGVSKWENANPLNIGHYQLVVTGASPPDIVTTPADDDFIYAWVS